MGLTVHFEVLNQLGTPMMYSSSLATRPAAGIEGRIFFRTDSPYGIYRDNGTSWDQIAGSGGGGGITGTGTATQIAYFNSATSLASSANLFWDNTNARLGINTATPGSSLDVHSAVQSVIQANNTTLGNSFASFQLQGTGKWQIGNVYNAGDNYFRIQDQLNTLERLTIRNTGQIDFLGYTQILNNVTGITGTTPSALPNNYYSNNFTYNSGITSVASVNTIGLDVDNSLNYSGANTINSTSYNTSSLLRNILTFGSAGASITYTQATGIRALVNDQVQYFQSGANSGTISHYANIQILGDNKNGAGTTIFTNRYGLLINDFNEFAAVNTYTNRWGIYQAGLNESNFFAGKVGIGSGYTPGTFQLDVIGTARVSGQISVNGFTISSPASGTLKFGSNPNTTGTNNSAFGDGAITANAYTNSAAFGQAALGIGSGNGNRVTGLGWYAGYSNSGSFNTYVGGFSGWNQTTGANNVIIGDTAANKISGGVTNLTIINNSILIGQNTKSLADNQTNQIVIGYDATGAGSNTATLGNTSIVKTILRGTLNAANLPTSSAGLVAGDIWNNLGILNIV